MKPTVAADEMFPEGVGPYMDLDEVCISIKKEITSLSSWYFFYFSRVPK